MKKPEESGRKALFLVLFMAGAAIAEQLNFSTIIGAPNAAFTAFQFFGPIVASFLGLGLGLAALLLSQAFNFVVLGKAVTAINILRLSTMMFAAYYFARVDFGAKKDYVTVGVPLACMALFLLTPAGGQAWYYSLYWLIPVAVAVFGWSKNLVARSLGATFTAHAVGSVIFAYSYSYTADMWTGLIPVVAYERLMFTAGIVVSYVAMTTVLDYASRYADLSALNIEKAHSLLRSQKAVA